MGNLQRQLALPFGSPKEKLELPSDTTLDQIGRHLIPRGQTIRSEPDGSLTIINHPVRFVSQGVTA